jgi:hypothetical protein
MRRSGKDARSGGGVSSAPQHTFAARRRSNRLSKRQVTYDEAFLKNTINTLREGIA